MTDALDLTLAEARDALKAKRISATEMSRAFLAAMEKARALHRVGGAVSETAPEFFFNRAKAHMPKLPAATTSWVGRQVLAPSAGVPGFRSANPVASNLRYEFEEGFVELRIEPTANAGVLAVVGFAEGLDEGPLTVSDGVKTTDCDAFGEFSLEIASDVTLLVLESATTNRRFEINLP